MKNEILALAKVYANNENYYAAAITAFTGSIVDKTKSDKLLADIAEQLKILSENCLCNSDVEDEDIWPEYS